MAKFKPLHEISKREREPGNKGNYEYLKKPLSKNDRAQNILDKGWTDGDYLGRLFSPSANPSATLIPIAKKTAQYFIYALTPTEEPRDWEGSRNVARVVRIERKHKAAHERKAADGFICKICGFDFSEYYPKLCDGFAEAHHKNPLALTIKEREVTPKDFATVCANCHRMLHWKKNRTVAQVMAAYKDGEKKRKLKQRAGGIR